jgi:hypothetical protein
MDRLSAVGLAGSIVAFVNFGCKAISTAKHIYKTGTTPENGHLNLVADDLYKFATRLDSKTRQVKMSDEKAVSTAATKCRKVSGELCTLLGTLQVKQMSPQHRFRAVIRDLWKKGDKDELMRRLDSVA